MESQPLVSVRGETLLEVEPEYATLDVSVGAQDRNREDTLASLDRRSSAVLALVESFGEAIDRVETAAVRMGPVFKDNKPRERITGYSAVIRHTVEVADFTRLGDLVARLAEQEMVDVYGPRWALRRDSEVYRNARVAAARDAVTRASEYASALGSRVTGLVELADTGLLTEAVTYGGGPAPYPVAAMAVSPSAMRAGAAPSAAPAPVVLDLEPVHQVVRASVEARFTIAPPETL